MNNPSRPEPIYMILANTLLCSLGASFFTFIFWFDFPFSLTDVLRRVVIIVFLSFFAAVLRELLVWWWRRAK